MICERVIVDHQRRNPTPVSIFNGLAVVEFPSSEQRFSVFTTLTNGSGNARLTLTVSRLGNEETIYVLLLSDDR